MNELSISQQVLSHLAYMQMAVGAEALPVKLENATKEKLGATAFLEHLLAVEVSTTEARGRAFLERFAFDAQPLMDWKLMNEPATAHGSGCQSVIRSRVS